MTEKIEKAPCNTCGRETRHHVVASREQPGAELIRDNPFDRGVEIRWCTTYHLLECCGCETITVKSLYWFSEDHPGEVTVKFYPPRVSRPVPRWLPQVSEEISVLMHEVYSALQSDSRALAMMGARAVLDLFITEKVGDQGTFQKKLAALEQGGYISVRNRKTLEAALEVGHAAAHRGFRPTSDAVNQVIDIVENVLQTDLVGDSVEALLEATPKRQPGKEANTNGGDLTG